MAVQQPDGDGGRVGGVGEADPPVRYAALPPCVGGLFQSGDSPLPKGLSPSGFPR